MPQQTAIDVGLPGARVRAIKPTYVLEAAILLAALLLTALLLARLPLIHPGLAAVVAAVGSAFLAAGLYGLRRTRQARRLVEALLARGSLTGLTVTPGLLIAFYAKIGKSTYLGSRFVPAAGPTADLAEAWRRASETGYAATRRWGHYFVAAPAVRVEDHCCRGVVVAALQRGWGSQSPARSLRICEGGACAEAELQAAKGVLEWRLRFYPSPGVRAARLEIVVKPTPPLREQGSYEQQRAAELAKAWLRIAETREPGEKHGTTRLSPSKPRAAILSPDVTSSLVVRRLWEELTEADVAAAPPAASITARLVLDIPRRPDKATETEITSHT